MTIDELKTFMIQWNNRFPYDRWWRKKHGIAFMSEEHRKCSFVAQRMEFEEDSIFSEIRKKELDKNDDVYTPNIGEWLKREDSGIIEEYDIEAFRREAALIAEMEDKE